VYDACDEESFELQSSAPSPHPSGRAEAPSKAADLPVTIAYQRALNSRTAKMSGLAIPAAPPARAGEAI
jgi:hypothetical protein